MDTMAVPFGTIQERKPSRGILLEAGLELPRAEKAKEKMVVSIPREGKEKEKKRKKRFKWISWQFKEPQFKRQPQLRRRQRKVEGGPNKAKQDSREGTRNLPVGQERQNAVQVLPRR